MTAQEVATLFGARPTGRGRWMAKCPAHQDRSPSLSIREGKNGTVLVHCFAGCTIESVLASRGLKVRDLKPPLSPVEFARLAEERRQRELSFSRLAAEQRARADRERVWAAAADALFAKLLIAEGDEADRLAELWHKALERMREGQ